MNEPVMLETPLDEKTARSLRAGQEVLLSGTVVTARDAAHRYLATRPDDDPLPLDLAGGVIYHCGPIVRKSGDTYDIVSAGPTTSDRMEMYEAAVIERYGLRAILGKGGMGPATAEALSKAGAVYLAATSGAGALLAKRIVRVEPAWKLEEFGTPEAMWVMRIERFPAIVAMDSEGGNLYTSVERESAEALRKLLGR